MMEAYETKHQEEYNTQQQIAFAKKFRSMEKRMASKAASGVYGYLCGFEAGYEAAQQDNPAMPSRQKPA